MAKQGGGRGMKLQWGAREANSAAGGTGGGCEAHGDSSTAEEALNKTSSLRLRICIAELERPLRLSRGQVANIGE